MKTTNYSYTKLSQTQTGIYIDSIRHEGKPVYNIPLLFYLNGVDDTERLRKALETTVATYAALSTHIKTDEEGNPVMFMGEPVEIESVEMSDKELHDTANSFVAPFSLEGGTLGRIKVIRTEKGVYLFFDFHHTICDGYSQKLFFGTLDAIYRGESVAPEKVTIYDVAKEEVEKRSTPEYLSARKAMTEMLAGTEQSIEFPSDLSGEGEVYCTECFNLGISSEEYERRCREMGMPMSVPATAAMGALLCQVCNVKDFTFATIYHGRKSKRYSGTFGMMVKTLPVRVSISDDTTLSQLLQNTKKNLGIARENDLYSFAEAASEFGVNSSFLFAYQGDFTEFPEFNNAPIEITYLEKLSTGSKITGEVTTTSDGLILKLDYRSDLYSRRLMKTLADFYASVLKGFISELQDSKAITLPLISESELSEVLKMSDGGRTLAGPSDTIPGLFIAAADKYPDHTAVIFDNKRLTYRELDRITDALSDHLTKEYGVKSGDTVGVLIDRSELMTIFPLAIMKAGGAYMPLDPHFPAERLSFMIEDAGLNLILEEDGLTSKSIPDFKGRIFPASAIYSIPKQDKRVANKATPDNPMVLLYTSGSTGKPKGVPLTQHNIVNYCAAYSNLISLSADDRVGAYAAFGFDAHTMDIYPALTSGASVYIFTSEIRLDLTAMHDYMESEKVTVMFMTTQIAWQMATLFDFTSLRVMCGGGEKLPPLDPLPYRFINLYGPTECSVACTAYEVTKPTDGRIIGKPLPGYQVRIVDSQMRPLPMGIPGEIMIFGDGVGLGYLNRQELTAEKFLTIDGVRAYRTGDQAKYNYDGEIEFIGRLDGLVKLRGLRIELGEIEAVAASHPAVQSFVAAVKEIGGMENLVGYYTLKEPSADSITPDDLKEYMQKSLTEFMVPSSILLLDKLPLTPNGKVDRRALPVPEIAIEEIVSPRTDAEKSIFEIVAGVLKHSDFGMTTNLLTVGLTSLLAMRLVAAIMKATGIKFKAKEIMTDPTVESLASRLNVAEADSPVEKETSKPKRRYYPLTENQRGVYLDWEMNRDALQYNIPQVFRFSANTDAERLRSAVIKVVKAHPGLMTGLVLRSGDIMQERHDDRLPEIPVIKLEEEPTAEFFQSRIRPFDLLTDSLFRCEIYLYKEYVYMLRDTHHIIFDGVSAMVFWQSLVEAYTGEIPEEETYSALDHSLDEKALLESDAADKAQEWFDALIEGTESTSYPYSNCPDNDISGCMGRLSVNMKSSAIKKFCSENTITTSNYMLAAFLQLLHRITREKYIQITTVNNGRNDLRLLNDTGMFVKTLPVVSRCEKPDMSPLEFANVIQQQFLTSQDYDFYPFTSMVERNGIRPEIMYVYEGGIVLGGDEGKTLHSESIPVALDTAKVPLTLLVFEPSVKEYDIVIEYDTSLYNRADMEVLAQMMRTLSQSLVGAETVADGKMTDTDQENLLSGIRNGETGPVPYVSFHGAMESWVDRTPSAPALVACDKRMNYAEFDAECNRIANALIKLGVKRGDRIVILLPRRSSLISAIYGTMKTGSAYIPCDPDYPADRIRLITEDSGARYIITTFDRTSLYPGKAVDINDLLAETDDTRPGVETAPDDIAYMIYTSGSTGRPKGVMIPQRGITNYLYGYYRQFYAPNPSIKVQMLLVTISFDASLVNLGGALTSGQCLVLADEDECKDVTLLSKLMLANKVDAFDITPSRLDAMLELPEFRKAVAACTLLNIGGEGFKSSLIEKLVEAGFNGLAVNEYGPTETTVGSNHSIIKPFTPITAGPPFYNYSNRIIDAWGSELPIGVTGELYIFGRSVGLGYNNLHDKTAEAFVDYHGERGYRTGDLARWTADGDVKILGRIDHQVKLRGLRIELGEIESVAQRFPGIVMAVADVREVNKIQHLCIYYTVTEHIEKEALRTYLAASLTEYMVPDAYTEVPTMPLTPNGKINRKALPAPEIAPLTPYIEPEGDLEIIIAKAFGKILKNDKVGANDDFFAIGGTSISAIKVVAALATSGYDISYKNVFTARTPRALAALIESFASRPDGDLLDNKVEKPLGTSEFADVLDVNTIDAFRYGNRQNLGNVFLTGATGFMGIHILHELLTKTDSNVFCLLRAKGEMSALSRLRTLLFYYFDNTFEPAFRSGRLKVIEGDVTGPVPEAFADAGIDTVINCAANVKHFSAGNDIDLVNVESVRNLIDFCVSTSSRLIHVSTVSIAGESINGYPNPSLLLTERMMDFGQSLANQYVHSKYQAEKLILEAVRERGLNAKIMRVGNLSARSTDGEFQINFRSNAFMGMLRAYSVMGCAPYGVLDNPCEFSPINEVCHAILLLATTPRDMVVFQPTNNHRFPLGDVLHILSEMGMPVEPVEMDEFIERERAVMDDPVKVDALQPLLAYSSDQASHASFIGYDSSYTNQILYRLGFRWSHTSHDYVRKFLNAIRGLSFFDL